MPYIATKRKELTPHTKETLRSSGELNFALTKICIEYFEMNGGRYQQINDIVGALECCKLEWYRRKAAPYEDIKIEENGDVYE